MRVAVLQFNPTLGAVHNNIDRANAILEASRPSQLDLLVLPELAFTGYNFPDLAAIEPYLEPTNAGPTAKWAIETAQRLGAHVHVGYPEIATTPGGGTRNYNATVTINPAGRVVASYRKSFLYYTDETWAVEGSGSSVEQPAEFWTGHLPNLAKDVVGMGICMDINPHRFETAWTAYEFANAMLRANARLVVLSTAWITRLTLEELHDQPDQPDMETMSYWFERLYPMQQKNSAEPVTVVFANRCGSEANKGENVDVVNGQLELEGTRVCYAGSSCVLRLHGGSVEILDRLGKGEERLLQVDTTEQAKYLRQPSVT